MRDCIGRKGCRPSGVVFGSPSWTHIELSALRHPLKSGLSSGASANSVSSLDSLGFCVFAPEALERLIVVTKKDQAKFARLRAQLKQAGCRVTAVDEALEEETGDEGGRGLKHATEGLELPQSSAPTRAFSSRSRRT